MNVRDLKLAIACENENKKVKSLNKFFDDLFSLVKIRDDETELIFYKETVDGRGCFMRFSLENGALWCVNIGFWEVLRTVYHCTIVETQEIIRYKVEEVFDVWSLTHHSIRVVYSLGE